MQEGKLNPNEGFSQLSLTEKIIFNLRRKAKEAEDEDDDE